MQRVGWDYKNGCAVQIEMTPEEETAFLRDQARLQAKRIARRSQFEQKQRIEQLEQAAIKALVRGDQAALATAREELRLAE